MLSIIKVSLSIKGACFSGNMLQLRCSKYLAPCNLSYHLLQNVSHKTFSHTAVLSLMWHVSDKAHQSSSSSASDERKLSGQKIDSALPVQKSSIRFVSSVEMKHSSGKMNIRCPQTITYYILSVCYRNDTL
jgi:hypothetical protein